MLLRLGAICGLGLVAVVVALALLRAPARARSVVVVVVERGAMGGGAGAGRATSAAGGDRASPSAIRASAGVGGHAVTLWLPYWSMAAAYDSATAHAGLVGTASPFWYAIAGDATVVDDPGAGDQAIVDGLHARGIAVVPTVTESEDLRAFDATLASARRRAAMIRSLVRIATTPGYDGLDLDFEQFALDPAHAAAPADEAAASYPSFVGQVCAALHARGRTCAVTVMPRTSAAHVYWRAKLATWVYDYAALAKSADRVQIMAYDEGAPGTAPGPVAGYPWVQQVIAYARSTMPPARAELGLAAYGYDFSGDGAVSVSSRQAPGLAAAHGATPRWDAAQQEETFAYGPRRHRHVVWYEDGRAEAVRAALARATGFAGVALWAAGGEDASFWGLLGRG